MRKHLAIKAIRHQIENDVYCTIRAYYYIQIKFRLCAQLIFFFLNFLRSYFVNARILFFANCYECDLPATD